MTGSPPPGAADTSLDIRTEGAVAYLTINRPDKRNALTTV
jgi:enoyl-CoA hydratase/carnithine racemase